MIVVFVDFSSKIMVILRAKCIIAGTYDISYCKCLNLWIKVEEIIFYVAFWTVLK